MIVQWDPQKSFIIHPALVGAIAIFVLAVAGAPRDLSAASSAQTPAKASEVMVYTSADEYSPLIETVRDGAAFSPIGEMTGAGGVKWFMVKTKSGNVGWIMASDNAEAKKIDDHFRALPKDTFLFGPSGEGTAGGSSAAAASTKDSTTGAITIPAKMIGNSMVVPVTFSTGNSSVTGNVLVDTGASQTMMSKRMASELRLLSVASQPRSGIGGTILADVGVVEMIRVGEAEVKNMRVSVHDFSRDQRYEGLLGFDFLGRFQMSVDSEKQLLVLTPRKK